MRDVTIRIAGNELVATTPPGLDAAAILDAMKAPAAGHQSGTSQVMVHRLDNGDASLEDAQMQVTVLNFSGEAIEGTVQSEHLIPRRRITDAASKKELGTVDDLGSFSVHLPPYGRMFLLVGPPDAEELAARG